MAKEVFKDGSRIGKEVVRVHRGGNRIDGVSHDNELFFTDLPIPNRSKINLSFDRKVSFDMGTLVPILAQECVPGDTFHIAQAHNLMLAPLIAPLYHRIDYRTWYFFVPTRLVQDNWKDFITYKNSDAIPPYFTGGLIKEAIHDSHAIGLNSLFDYFDLPVQQDAFLNNARHICAHVFRMYNLIYNEYFRDEFKQPEIPISKTDGEITTAELLTYICRKIGWEKDYFTTCQANPQFGADVPLPGQGGGSFDPSSLSIGTNGPLRFTYGNGYNPSTGTYTPFIPTSENAHNGRLGIPTAPSGVINPPVTLHTSAGASASYVFYESGLKLKQNITRDNATVATINDLRIANHLQRYRDKLQIAGARYNEAILSEFGVVVPDYRIQRPEYIGGYAQPVQIGKVNQNTPTENSPLGDYAGQASGAGRMDYIHYDCKEHGYIIGLSCVVPRTGYDQGIPRMFKKDGLFDYYHPDFATLGDQEVLNDELYVSDNIDTGEPDDSRFGYQQRYAEYKIANDKTNGEFRTNLDFWHMNRKFDSLPVLNGDFVEADPTERIFAVQDEENKIYAEIYQQIDSVRPMPISVVPTLDD